MGVTAASATHAAKPGHSHRPAPAAAFLARPTSLLQKRTCDCGATAGLSGHCATCDRASLGSRPGSGEAADVLSFAAGSSPEPAPELGRLGISSAVSQSAVKPSAVAVPKPPVLAPATIVAPHPRISGSSHGAGKVPVRPSFDVAPRAAAAPAPVARRPPEPAPVRPTPPVSLVRQRSPVRVQTEMRVSSPADPAEREAQSVGKMIARMPDPDAKSPAVQGAAAAGTVQREAAPVISDRSADPPTAHRLEAGGPADPHVLAELHATSSSGSSLPADVRSFMEPRFRADFSGVRIHSDAHAARVSAQLGARAFTVGKDIYFAKGQFRPESADGWELIAHELTHTIQQGGVGRPPPAQPAAAEPTPAQPPAARLPAARTAGAAPGGGARPGAAGTPPIAAPAAPVPKPAAPIAPTTKPVPSARGAEAAPGKSAPAAARSDPSARRADPALNGAADVPRDREPAGTEPKMAAPRPPARPVAARSPPAPALPAAARPANPVAAAPATSAATAAANPVAAAVAHVAEPVHHLAATHAPAPARAPVPAQAAEHGKKPPPPRAAAPVRPGTPYTIAERAPVSLQRFGLSDALGFFADQANVIPGFRMLTIILGVNPINMSPVDRSAANILRALIEFIPGGGLITKALDNSGVFDKVGAWVAEQIETLAMTGGALKQAVMDLLGSLSWKDVLNLSGVWERAKRIFTDPIDRLIKFAEGLATAILKFIKDAILLPLAKLAEGTRGWDLLIGVLGRNPITGDTVQRTPELLIGGFLKLIGQDEIWQNMQKSGAIQRAWAWFQGALNTVLGFVSQIPALFTAAFQSLTIEDVVLVVGAFRKVASVFGDFLGKFTDWAGTAIWNLLEIIFDVVSPGALTYVKKTGAALRGILKDPLPFVHNLVGAAKLGLSNFADNFGTHLKEALIEWLTGSLPGVYIPKAVSLLEFGKFALSIIGISWLQIRAKIVKALGPTGETIMKGLEQAFDVVKALVTGGIAAAWELIKEKLTNLKDMVVDGIVGFVSDTIVKKAIPKLVSLFVPGAGFISAIISIYDTIKVFLDKLAKIGALVKSFVDSIVAIAGGDISGAAKRVESALTGALSLAISFLAGFLSLGDIPAKIMVVVKKVQDTVDKALDTAITWIITKAKALFGSLFGGKDGKPDPRTDAQKASDLRQGVAEATALLKDKTLTTLDVSKKLPAIQKKYNLASLVVVIDSKTDTKQSEHIHGAVNPELDGAEVEAAPDEDGGLDPQSIWEEVIGASDANQKPQTRLDQTSVAHGKQQIVGILAAGNVPASDADSAIATIDALLQRALQETSGDAISSRMASVSGVANQALRLGSTGTVVNVHHIQQVAMHPGTYPGTARDRTHVPAKYKTAIEAWVRQQTAAGLKNLKAKKEEIVALLRQQLFEDKNPNLEMPLAEVEMVVTTATAHRAGHQAIAQQDAPE